MNESPKQLESPDWPDRLIDQGLRESVGGETPPDLTDAILVAAENQLVSPEPNVMSAEPVAKRRYEWTRWLVAASVSFIAGGVSVMAFDASRQSAREVASTASSADKETTELYAYGGTSTESALPSVNANVARAKTERGFQRLDAPLTALPAAEPKASGAVRETESLAPARGVATFNRRTVAVPSSPVPLAKASPPLPRSIRPVTPSYLEPSREESEPECCAEEPASPTGNFARGGRGATPTDGKNSEKLLSSLDGGFIHDAQEFGRADSDQNFEFDGQDGDGLNKAGVALEAELEFEHRGLQELEESLAAIDTNGRFDRQAGSNADGRAAETLRRSIALRRGRIEGLEDQLQQFQEGRGPGQGGDQYTAVHENPFVAAVGGDAVSTFSIDVDTASYANVRQMLTAGRLPPPDAVRLEELINYFHYGYAAPHDHPDVDTPEDNAPFAAHMDVAACPWTPEHQIVRIGVKGRELETENRPLTNLVFLIDVSGSMNEPNKHPLVIEGLKALTKELGENDRVAIVVYASQEGLALPSVTGSNQETILAALESLRAGGSTAGGAGIRLAYQIAEDNFIEGGANRVILCTDGDFNVGATSTAELERLVAKKAKDTGVFLSVCGFGRGNLNDAMMETISGKGNGNYYYIDTLKEAEKVFVKGLTGTLVTIAKDVKIQVEFNPAKVAGYRLLGYENRMLRTQDFNDDRKDAGEIGAGHTVTALYEIVPTGKQVPAPAIDDLKYQRTAGLTPEAAASPDLLTLKMRYKQPGGDKSTKLEWPLAYPIRTDRPAGVAADTQFATAVAGFGMLLRNSQHAGGANFAMIEEIAQGSLATTGDPDGAKAEFVELVRKAKTLRGEAPGFSADQVGPAATTPRR
ncbi:MAG: von Willebrand factor type A domain-containing protein [Planctomycetota bacterium]